MPRNGLHLPVVGMPEDTGAMSLETLAHVIESGALNFGATKVFMVVDGRQDEIASVEFSARENAVFLKAAE